MVHGQLSTYHEKRNFNLTTEPRGKAGAKARENLCFVIQLHEARRTHYDFRLEWNGVMKSWAVTKGPSYDPEDKRLAVRTEDHPMEYNKFEGVIPDKQYGAGPVMIWDQGTWLPDGDPVKMEKKGHISFAIKGSRMKGHWHLIRMRANEKRENWLLIKGKDEFALGKADSSKFLQKENSSIVSGRTMPEIRKGHVGKTTRSDNTKLSALLKKYDDPELSTLVDAAPSGPDWLHEIKYDGYRLMAFVAQGKVVLRTRGGKDWTHKFTPLAEAISGLGVESAVFDLEACVLNQNGKTDFSALQEALSEGRAEIIEGWIFDLLFLNGDDFCKKPLTERKKTLARLLKGAQAPLHYSDHFESSPDLLEKACKIGAEGLVSKKKDSLYRGRRTREWVKSKCNLEQEFVIGGFMPSKDNPKAVGALLLGYYKNRKLLYAGKVGTGFSQKTSKDVYKKLIQLEINQNPFPEKPPRGLRPYVYVRPELLCEIVFMEWTADGQIRHGAFKGLREDKDPKAVKEEIPEKVKAARKKTDKYEIMDVVITHPDREVYPGTGITKSDVATYYAKVAPLMLSYIDNRLISLLRCTDGVGGQCFFQRNPMKGMGNEIKSKAVTHKGKAHEYLYTRSERGIIQLAQMGTVEFHSWQSTVSSKGRPDQIIFDLDPDEDVPFEAVKLAAEDIRLRLKRQGLVSFARVSGGKGIHVVVPFRPEYGWDQIKDYARSFAGQMVEDAPDAYVSNMSKAKRKGKIFIDFFRNDFSSTAIVPYSLRARDGAPIAWPVSWADLRKIESASFFRLGELKEADFRKAARITDEFLKCDQKLDLQGDTVRTRKARAS